MKSKIVSSQFLHLLHYTFIVNVVKGPLTESHQRPMVGADSEMWGTFQTIPCFFYCLHHRANSISVVRYPFWVFVNLVLPVEIRNFFPSSSWINTKPIPPFLAASVYRKVLLFLSKGLKITGLGSSFFTASNSSCCLSS